ncbi:hypothetical protein UFOVP330_45 [uncultured Caudovirales phage]|uniref:Uncharacterized protein n=1 Tax=uncultured Caudovirales phage TaxID=2100421 RepID=A0A6J5LZ16_9CAUD|nr:hypothetical protein UFOVP330_45 [uncultured Caudovirales phage]
MPIVLNGATGLTTPGISVDGATASVSGGFSSAIDSDGTFSGGTTYTPTLTPSNWKYIINGGAFTLAAPAAVDAGQAYSMIIYVLNSATAGTLTLSGFNRVVGDALTTTNGHVFFLFITVFGTGAKVVSVVAAQ